MSGDLILYHPGEEVTVTLVAGTGGAYPTRGEGVELNGDEGTAHPHATEVTGAGTYIGNLVELPPDFDDPGDLADGDTIGEVTVRTCHHVEWMTSNDAALVPGDFVVYGADGVAAYDNAGGDTPEQIVGRVFKTAGDAEGTEGKVAVMKTA